MNDKKSENKRKSITENEASFFKKNRGDLLFKQNFIQTFNNKFLINESVLSPAEYPFNKDGYRYILAEPDPNAPFALEYHNDDSGLLAGKPIPSFLYRMYVSDSVTLSLNDRAHQLKVSENKMTVIGEKGYSLIRATHGINNGTWFYECRIQEMPKNTATRIGWTQQYANLQAPLGYDKFGYSWRSKRGTLFHESRGMHFNREHSSYKAGDVLGFFIHLPSLKTNENLKYIGQAESLLLPETIAKNIPFYNDVLANMTVQSGNNDTPNNVTLSRNKGSAPAPKNNTGIEYPSVLEDSCKNSPLVKFKGYFYFEQKENVEYHNKRLKPLPGSMIAFYKNGQLIEKKAIQIDYQDFKDLKIGTKKGTVLKICDTPHSNVEIQPEAFTDLYLGTYFPAISLYFNASVSFNPGPNFDCPPTRFPHDLQPRPVSDLPFVLAAQQSLNDLLFFICNEDNFNI